MYTVFQEWFRQVMAGLGVQRWWVRQLPEAVTPPMVSTVFNSWLRRTMTYADVRRSSLGQLVELTSKSRRRWLYNNLLNCTYEACKLASKSLDADWVLYFDRHSP